MSDFPIIGKLGGRQAVFDLLRAKAPDKIETIDALRMWAARGQVPGWGQLLLIEAAMMGRIRWTVADFKLPAPESVRKRRRA